MNRAAISLVQRQDGKVLVVWNRRYQGWSLPGGKVEEGETIEQALGRELMEETGLEIVSAWQIYEAPSLTTKEPDRVRHVHVFKVVARGEPFAGEAGCPVVWMGMLEFVRMSVFGAFYDRMLQALAKDVGNHIAEWGG